MEKKPPPPSVKLKPELQRNLSEKNAGQDSPVDDEVEESLGRYMVCTQTQSISSRQLTRHRGKDDLTAERLTEPLLLTSPGTQRLAITAATHWRRHDTASVGFPPNTQARSLLMEQHKIHPE